MMGSISNTMNRTLSVTLLAGTCCLPVPALAQESGEGAEAPAGILPIPDYGGDIWTRSHLTGDWGGKRTDWAEMGIQFDVDSVTWVDTVVDGGRSNDAEFGGNVQYDLDLDLMRAGIIPGALIQVRGESRFGSSGILNQGGGDTEQHGRSLPHQLL